jgi:hypothetical protein
MPNKKNKNRAKTHKKQSKLGVKSKPKNFSAPKIRKVRSAKKPGAKFQSGAARLSDTTDGGDLHEKYDLREVKPPPNPHMGSDQAT